MPPGRQRWPVGHGGRQRRVGRVVDGGLVGFLCQEFDVDFVRVVVVEEPAGYAPALRALHFEYDAKTPVQKFVFCAHDRSDFYALIRLPVSGTITLLPEHESAVLDPDVIFDVLTRERVCGGGISGPGLDRPGSGEVGR